MSRTLRRRPASSALKSESILPEPLDRSQLVQELKDAIVRDELFVCYQPKYRAYTDSVDAVEALVRWLHPINGLIPPDQFIGVAEENGLIQDLTRWVAERVLVDRERLAQSGYPLTVYINLSAQLAADRAFTDWMAKTAKGLEPGALGLEITAQALQGDVEATLKCLDRLAKAGLTITVDDFGKGAWSLALLRRMPARELKIDRSVIADLTSGPNGARLVRAVIEFAHALEMQVTAVGVENEAQLRLLQTMGCDMVQGFVVSPAIEMIDLQDYLAVAPGGEEDAQPRRHAG